MKKEKTKLSNVAFDVFAAIFFMIIVIGSIFSITLNVQHFLEHGEEAVIEHINSSDRDVIDKIMEHLEEKYTTTKSLNKDIDYLDDDIEYLDILQEESSDEIDAILEYFNLELYTERTVSGYCSLCKDFSDSCLDPEAKMFCNFEEITKVKKIK